MQTTFVILDFRSMMELGEKLNVCCLYNVVMKPSKLRTVYCVHPISGSTPDEVFSYYESIKLKMSPYYDVLIPMTGKSSLRCAKELRAHGHNELPITTNHAIFERDRWMVTQSDIVYANLIGATERVSIGSMFELAWASILGKYVILAMDKESVHKHAFVLEAADAIFESSEEAETYLLTLAQETL